MKPLFLSKSVIVLFVFVSFNQRCYSATTSTTGTPIAGSPTASTKSPASLPQTQGISAGKLPSGSASVPVTTHTTVVALQPKSTSSLGSNANGSTVMPLATSTQNPALTKTPSSVNGSSSTSAVFSSQTSLNPSPGPKTSASIHGPSSPGPKTSASIHGPSSPMSASNTAPPFMSKPPLPPVANGNQNPGANGNLPAWATLLLNNVPGLTGQGAASIAKTLGINTESIVSSGLQLMQIVQQIGQYANMLQTVLSPKCVKDLNVFQQSLGKMEIWALKMLDAAGKIKPGILKGQKVLVGDYDECMEISPVITGQHLIDGNFCKLDVNTNFTGLGPAGAALAKLLPVVTIHVCVPNSCNATDLYNLFYGVVETVGGQSAELVATKCIHSKDPSDDSAFWAAIAVLAFLVLMCVIGTIYGQLLDRRAEKYKEKEAASPEAPTTHTGHVNAAFDNNINKNDPPTVELTAIVSSDNWIMKSPEKKGDSAPTLLSANGNGVTPPMTPPNGNVASGTSPKKQVPRQQEGMCSKLLLSFSVLKNGSKILNCVQGQGDLGCLHGIRVLSITWVILGHCFSMFADT
ncbi:hypothetical protein V1264_008346 [Littorina saxatilis]|uniref:Nose resistant-to-fluoxetine protein N-terminal domain-containing protein n=2 Tax=Littorina saxatilis TaxID=31220 RepID=A0AAN9G275_9CAEN